MTDSTTSAHRIQHLAGATDYPTWAARIIDILTDMQLDDYPSGRILKPGTAVPAVVVTPFSGTGTGTSQQLSAAAAAAQPATPTPAAVSTPAIGAQSIADWERKDRQALSAIRLRVSDAPLVYITNAKTSKEAWDTLEKMYRPRGAFAVVLLRRKLLHMQCPEGGDIEEHIRKLTSLRTQLQALGSTFGEDEFSTTLLTSLPDSWNPFIQTVDTSSFTDSAPIIARVLEQDRQKTAKPNSDAVALAAKPFRPGKSQSHSGLVCYGCGRPGHIVADCRDTKRGKTFTDEQKRRNYDKAKGIGGQSARAHVSEVMPSANLPPPATVSYAFMATALPPEPGADTWLADSAATDHIVRNRSLFSLYTDTPGASVTGFGSAASPGIGSAEIASHVGNKAYSLTLRDTLHVPEAPYNLISIGRLTAGGCSIKFSGDTMKVIAPDSHEIMRGTRVGNLYKVHITRSPRSPPPTPSPSPNIALASGKPATHSWDKWHRIFGHMQHKSVQLLHDKHMVTGMQIDAASLPPSHCETCVQAKAHVMPFPPQSDTKYTEIGEMTFTDVWGPAQVTGIDGSRYYASFTDAATRRSIVYFMKAKSEVKDKMRDYDAYIFTQTGKRIKCFRCDNGGEYVNHEVRAYLAERGIRLQLTAPYSPSQNGVAERLNRTLVEHARAMLAAHDLPLFLWPEAVAYACYLKNRSPTAALTGFITPDEAFWKRKPDVSTLQEFGIPCEVLKQSKQQQGKLFVKTRPFRFMGLSDESTAWRYYNPEIRQVLTTRNISFGPDTPPQSSAIPDPPSAQLEGEISASAPAVEPAPPVAQPPVNPATGPVNPTAEASSIPPESPTVPTSRLPRSTRKDVDYRLLNNPSARSSKTPDAWKHRVASQDSPNIAMAARAQSTSDPLTIAEARARADWPEWKSAMDEEIAQLYALGTFTLEDLPSNRSPVACKWVFRTKYDDTGNISRYKARLVAKGFSQIPGIDFDETFAPVVRIETVRLLLALAARYNLQVHVVDVVGAYLNGKLDEEIYMQQPPLFEDGTPRVCRLHRTLYGLKQSGRVWNLQLNDSFLKLGYTRLTSDQCVYIRRAGADMSIIAVHVDDMTILTSSDSLMSRVEAELDAEFTIKKLGAIRQLLGMEVTRTADFIRLTQTQYISKMLEKYQLDNANPVHTPIDPNVRLARLPDDQSFPDVKHVYQNMVGSLLYAAITTRPDISFAVQTLSQFNTNPGPEHLTAAKRVFRYLKGTIDLGIEYHANHPSTTFDLFSDADWGSDVATRRSITGYLSTFAGGAVTWNSKKQVTVALSSMEAEYMALASATREALWLRTLFSELGLDTTLPTHISVDNQGTILFAENSGFHARSKHIDIRYHFIRETLTSNQVSVSYIPTDENTADIFTKGLVRAKHEYLTSRLGMIRA
jgi:transposase InsO family protein